MADKAKETITEDIHRVKTLVIEAIKSGAYLYPLKVKPHPNSISKQFSG